MQRLCEIGENIGSPSFPPSLSHRAPFFFFYFFFAGITSERAKSGALLDDPRGSRGTSNRGEGESLELRTKNRREARREEEEEAARGKKRRGEKYKK